MLESQKDELRDDEDTIGTGDGGDGEESLSISERRARRRQRRRSETDDDSASEIAARKESRTRSQKEALRARERQAQGFGENIPVLGRAVTYLRGVSAETQKVTWPTRDEARQLTIMVLSVTILFSIMLGLIDVFYGWWFQAGVESTVTFLIVGVPFVLIGGGLSWWYILREE